MSETIDLHKVAMDMLIKTSRTFVIPISRLSPGLQEAVAAAYLCMRAIDEIEDHPQLPNETKVNLLHKISRILQTSFVPSEFSALLQPYKADLPEVSLRIGEWTSLIPPESSSAVFLATAEMADGMADWIMKEWKIETEEDLDNYTYYVAGLVGTMLSELWKWHDGLETDRELAVGFGRGLQSVNIIRNREEDLSRGVDFFPKGWDMDDMFKYARRNLDLAEAYTKEIKQGPILDFCKIPLVLAKGTLDAIEAGRAKLSRTDVNQLVKNVTG